jgi:hypothetical protein
MRLEERRISPRMGLPMSPFSKESAPYEQGYHNQEGGLLPSSKTALEEAQEVPAQEEQQEE